VSGPLTTASAPQISVLFVDDEQNVRSGLQRMLRGMRGSWNMRFAGSGNEALEMMRTLPADVVVSDMRMPGMDGRELLARIEQGFPNTVRIILSGQCDRENTLRTVGRTHLFLAKPCETDRLIDAINRACRLRAKNRESRLANTGAGLRDVPEPPAVYLDLVAALEAPEVSAEAVARILDKDAALAATLLDLLNATPLVGSRPMAATAQAYQLLGPDLLPPFVLKSCLTNQLACRDRDADNIAHCLRAAIIGRQIAHDIGLDPHDVSSAFSAGLLHDVGSWMLWSRLPGRYAGIVDQAPSEGGRRRELERREFGATHAEVGASLLERWDLPLAVVEAVAFHHEPALSGVQAISVVGAVHVASAIADRANGEEADLDRAYLSGSGMLERIEGWRGSEISLGSQTT